MTSGLFEIIKLGGPLMWVLFLGSVLAVGVFVERMIFFHRCAINVEYFLKGLGNLLREGRYDEALERCDEAYGPAVRVAQTAILKRHLPKSDLREIVQEVAQLQVPRLEANLPLITTVASISPLIGLLGTVIGMIKAFMQMNAARGAAPVSDLAGGIWEALITTAGGLVVAIPCYVAYNYLSSRLNGIITDMERSGIEVVQLLTLTPAPSVEKKPEAAVKPAPMAEENKTPAADKK